MSRPFVFSDKQSEKLYNRVTNHGKNQEVVDYFSNMTRSFDGCFNAMPDLCSIFMDGVIATEVYYVSESSTLLKKLERIISSMSHLPSSKRDGYHDRLSEFIDRAQTNVGMLSVSHLAEEPLTVRSHLFKSVRISLEFAGGYLIRLFFSYEPTGFLSDWLWRITDTQYDTKLRLWLKNPLLRRGICAQPSLGNDRKRRDIVKFDEAVKADIRRITRSQFLAGIYLGEFNGLPILHRYLVMEPTPKSNAPESPLPPNESSNIIELLSSPSNAYTRTQYSSDTGAKLIELSPHSGRVLSAYAKTFATGQNNISCFDILRIFADKEALRLQSSLIYDVERQYVSSLIKKNTRSLKEERQEMHKQQAIYDTLRGAFDFSNKLRGHDASGPATGFLLPIGHDKKTDYGQYGYGQILQASKLIRERLDPLIRRSEVVKEESEAAFQRWIQRATIILTLFLFPIAQILWERVADSLFPSSSAPIDRPAKMPRKSHGP